MPDAATAEPPSGSSRQTNPQPPPSSLSASTSSFFPFFSGRYTASFSGLTMPRNPGSRNPWALRPRKMIFPLRKTLTSSL